MGSFLSGIWKYIAGVGAALVAILMFVVYILKGQRDSALESAQKAKDSLHVSEKTRTKENDIAQAQHEAEVKSNEIEKEHAERPSTERPSGSWRR